MSQWTCLICTYLNHPSLHQCEICEIKRQPNPSQSISTVSDFHFAQRMQAQFDNETTAIQTHTKIQHNKVSKHDPHPNTTQTPSPRQITTHNPSHSNSKSPSANSSTTHNLSPTIHEYNNEYNNDNNSNRKRKRSEIESELPHHSQCIIKEEEIKCEGDQDIIQRIEHVRAGYEEQSHHNAISTLYPQSQHSRRRSASPGGVIGTKRQNRKGVCIAGDGEPPFFYCGFQYHASKRSIVFYQTSDVVQKFTNVR
eukprot:788695_1